MRADGAAIRDFMAQRRIALVGLSHQEKDFSRAVLHELVAHGYDVVPVNPSGGEIEGRHVYPRVLDIDGDVDGALVMTPASASASVVRDCARAGIRRVWLHRGVGTGAVSDEAVQAGEEAGLSVVAGACPLMFFEHPGFIHRVHAFAMKLAGTFPSEPVAPPTAT